MGKRGSLVMILGLALTLHTGVALARGGHYKGGKGGSSHKGGSYKNRQTGDHYRHRDGQQ